MKYVCGNLIHKKVTELLNHSTATTPSFFLSVLNSVHRSIICSWPIFLYKNNNNVSWVQLTFLMLLYWWMHAWLARTVFQFFIPLCTFYMKNISCIWHFCWSCIKCTNRMNNVKIILASQVCIHQYSNMKSVSCAQLALLSFVYKVHNGMNNVKMVLASLSYEVASSFATA